MIPKIIHQTWRDENIPGPREWPESWRRHNPDWEYRLWTDADLQALVHDHYPDLTELFHAYPNPVQRADMGRYLILHRHGGVYADIDTECLAPLDALASETRVVLAEEPVEHRYHTHPLGMDRMFFNGILASPQGHSFWPHMTAMLVRCAEARAFVLESTGPLALTGAVESFPDPGGLALNSCHIFNPLTERGTESSARRYGPYSDLHFANHYWGGSWWKKAGKARRHRAKRNLRKLRYLMTRGPHLTRAYIDGQVDKSVLHRPISTDDTNIAVLIPVRDGEPFIERCMELLTGFDYPKKKIKIVFCEGDSIDGSAGKLRAIVDRYRSDFRDIVLTEFRTGSALDRDNRWRPHLQRARRSNLARVRNHLIERGLADDDHWALWIDVDVCDYAPGILRRLLDERSKIVTPDCVRDWGGPSYDLNAFNDNGEIRDHRYYKHVRDGLYMPPSNHDRRRHLHDLRFTDRVPLSSVGGTMLLVHASVHRAGIRFPELPYDDLIETEGFGRICRDFGVTPIGLPNVQIRHVRS